jgi:C4-dicarboxylate-specific signal transduction histidine kinase
MDGAVLVIDGGSTGGISLEPRPVASPAVVVAAAGSDAVDRLRQPEVFAVLFDEAAMNTNVSGWVESARARFPDVVRVLVTEVDGGAEAILDGRANLLLRRPWSSVALEAVLIQARDLHQTRRRLARVEQQLCRAGRHYALGVVASGIAHEIRNALTPLAMSIEVAQMLAESPAPDDTFTQASMLAEALNGVLAIGDLVDAVNLASRPGRATDVDLAETTKLACRALAGELRRRGRLELRIAPAPKVHAAPSLVGHLVLHLLVHALEGLDPARLPHNAIFVEVGRDGSGATLVVTVEGTDAASSASEDALGLGLVLARQVTAELAGTLRVEGAAGGGVRCLVWLPGRAG